MSGSKNCTKCKLLHALHDYPKCSAAKDGAGSWCKKCVKEWNTVYRKNNRHQIRKTHREWSSKNKDKKRSYALKDAYSITLSDYNLLLLSQKGKCAICRTLQSKIKKTFSVDHSHNSGIVRGLLCQHCNTGLGQFRDNETYLLRAIEYLRKTHEKK